MKTSTSILLITFFLAACGGAVVTPEGEGPATGGTEATGGEHGDAAALAARDFDSLSPEEKGEFMEQVVMPAMKPLFQQFDGEEFAQFTCRTCHGANARAVNFHMPNGVHPLDPAHMPSMDGEDGRWMHFMAEQVKPKMAQLLHQEEWAPTNQDGFGCFNCHGMVGGPGAPPAATAHHDDDDDDDAEHGEHGGEHGEHGEHAEHGGRGHGGHH